MSRKPIAVIGAGSWGSALAVLLGRKKLPVRLWVFEPELEQLIRQTRQNAWFLPGIDFPKEIFVSNSLEKTLSDVDFIVWVTPSHTVRPVFFEAKRYITSGAILVGASKGIENDTLKRMSEVIAELSEPELDIHYLTLSGPTFAREVAERQPTTAVVAGNNPEFVRHAQEILNSEYFRVYVNEDQVGVELGGALKNVIAIAAGIASGLGLGSNTRAALITRGLWEITRLGTAMNANPLTFLGLAGMGDLVLTCDGTQSRNFQVGRRLGKGESWAEIFASMKMVAEGVKTAKSVMALSRQYSIEMPISEQIYQVLYDGKSPLSALKELMSRSLKAEHHFSRI